ncbi:uncharacterized protein N7459_008831 [Penicillium hispanicum]|uniref:uncharacterized protein n=1 Tax=Penicillium hispanicum TaxID=1080232 RepID=UPI0025408243|nr:uncharacterized protein N7459_008831 [Penicillium hispanicum]KAJ5574404.1 hypothetical protein N7459_008831 [Penicillium hispanicum]
MTAPINPRAIEISISSGKHNIAISEIIIFSIVHVVQLTLRYIQEQRYWHHSKNKNPIRCILYSWFSMSGLLAQIRIASSAMILSTSHPSESILIAESSMQSVGLSPLFVEVSFVLLRCGQAGQYGPGNSKHSKTTRFWLHFFRLPVVISIILAVVGGIIEIRPLGEAGTVILVVMFALMCGLIAWLAANSRSNLPGAGYRGILVIAITLPFLLVRIIYFLLQEYGPSDFNPVTGNVGILAGMGLLMEIVIVSLLQTARAVVEPVQLAGEKRCVEEDNTEWS